MTDANEYLSIVNASVARKEPGEPTAPRTFLGHQLGRFGKYTSLSLFAAKRWRIVLAGLADGTVRVWVYHAHAAHVVYAGGVVEAPYVPLIRSLSLRDDATTVVGRVVMLSEDLVGLAIGSWDRTTKQFTSLQRVIPMPTVLDPDQVAELTLAVLSARVEAQAGHITRLLDRNPPAPQYLFVPRQMPEPAN